MQKYFFIVSIFLIHITLFAQQETLFNGNFESGFFVAPSVKITPTIYKEAGVLVGGYGGWLINHSFLIGAGGYGLVTPHEAAALTKDYYGIGGWISRIEFGYGGVVIEYIHAPNNLIHFYANVLIGAGGVNVRYYNWWMFGFDNEGHMNFQLVRTMPDMFFIIEPSVNAELNVIEWMRFDAGVSYRYISGIDKIVGLNNSDLIGFSGQLTLKFGMF